MNHSSGNLHFDLETLSKADLVRILQKALSDPEGFPLWVRRELSSRQGETSFEREIGAQIQEVFGSFDTETDASDLIESIRNAVATGTASIDQGASWALEALLTADEAIGNHEDCEYECSCDLDDLAELALDLLKRSTQTGKELAESLLSLLGLGYMGIPAVDLTVFAQRLGAEGLGVMRSALEGKKYPNRSLLMRIYEFQEDRSAWITLKLESSHAEDQIAALEWIQEAESLGAALNRAKSHLAAQVTGRHEALAVREWWYRRRQEAGDSLGAIVADAWATFLRHPSLPEAWALLETWAKTACSWGEFRQRALEHLEFKDSSSKVMGIRDALIRIARSEGRARDAWEIARRGLPRSQMLDAIAKAAKEWPDEAQQEFDRIMDSALRGLERTNSQGLYQEFANLIGRGCGLFGQAWRTAWSDKVAAKYPNRPKLLQFVAKA